MLKQRKKRSLSPFCAVSICNLGVMVNIGVGELERSAPQKLFIDCKISFLEFPEGCISDNLADTLCYDKICSLIPASIIGKEFKLIESFGYYIYNILKACNLDYPLYLRVKKFPKIPNLEEGYTLFEIEG